MRIVVLTFLGSLAVGPATAQTLLDTGSLRPLGTSLAVRPLAVRPLPDALFEDGVGAGEAVSPLVFGLAGSLLATVLWVNFGPNWDGADHEPREDLGWYVGSVVGGTAGVWIEGTRKREGGSLPAVLAGAGAGLLLGALHAGATEQDDPLSYAALGALPPLGAAIAWAWTAGERR